MILMRFAASQSPIISESLSTGRDSRTFSYFSGPTILWM
jgi:hypothetical protein